MWIKGRLGLSHDAIIASAEAQKEPSFIVAFIREQGVTSAITEWANSALTRLFHLEHNDVISQSPSVFLDAQALEFIEHFVADQTNNSARLKNALRFSEDFQESTWRDLEISSFVCAEKGTTRIYGRLVDVTEREELRSLLDAANAKIDTIQSRFEHAVNSIPEGFAMFDRNDVLVACNAKYLELYKQTAPAIKVGATFESIMRYGIEHGQYPEAEGCEEAWLAERLNRENRKRAPVERKLPGGKYLRVHEVENEHGDLVGLRSDVTRYYEQQQALEQKAAELAAANEEVRSASIQKEQFFSRMSHELRTPMNGILGMAEVLQHSALDPQQEVYLKTIASSAAGLLGIINDILDYSKATEGKFWFANEEFSLKDTLYEATRLLGSLAHEKNLDLWIEYPKTVPTHFVGDSARIRQVILNHLGNALKFTDEGHFGIRVGYDPNGSAPRLKLSIVDTGQGIPEASMASLFSAYEQVSQDTAKVVEGTGLGLAIAKSLVDQMGGTIEVESQVGRGSCFTVSLDLEPCRDYTLTTEHPQPSLSKRDVAIVGAANVSNGSLAAMLQEYGCRVHWIGQGDAPSANGKLPFDAVIWDSDFEEQTGNLSRLGFKDQKSTCANVLLTSVPSSKLMASLEHIQFAKTVLKPARWEDFAPVFTLEATRPADSRVSAQVGRVETRLSSGAHRASVLIVDDNKTNRLVAGKLLETAGITADFACDGLEAVRLYEDMQPRTIFMDVTMPVLDGLEATRRIRQIEAERGLPACTVYALTANTSKSQVELCFDAGVDGVIAKPVKRKDLVDAFKPTHAAIAPR